jgi:hypothetical protein
VRVERGGRSGESTSGPAFHNAPGALKPHGHSVRARLVPSLRYRRQAPLLSLALEAQPAIAVLAGDRNRSPEGCPSALGSATAVPVTGVRRVSARTSRCPAIDLPSLGGGWRDQPNLPPSARRVEKRPITHRQVPPSRSCAKVCARNFLKHGGCQNSPFSRRFLLDFFAETYVLPVSPLA